MVVETSQPQDPGSVALPRGPRKSGGGMFLLSLVFVGVMGLFVADALGWLSDSRDGDSAQVLVHTIARGDFEAFITETGDVESSDNVEIVCELEAPPGSRGTRILEVVPEGTMVKTGDFLIAFDDSALKQRLIDQETLVATDAAAVIEAKSEYEKAQQSLNEYTDGTFLVDQETYEADVLTAESLVKSHRDQLGHMQKMYRKGFVSRLQLETQAENLEIAEKAVKVAQIKLMALKKYTRAKSIAEFTADIAKQKAFLKAAERKWELSKDKLAELTEQKNKCRIVAPKDGQVVYANDYERRENVVIQEGEEIRQRQVVLRLPDPSKMRILAKINDGKLNRIRVDDSVKIVLDVDPDLALAGRLSEINPYPYPRRWHGAPIEYGAKIEVINPPTSLRPGQRAKVHIYTAHAKDAVQAPIQSVVERDGKHYCLVRDKSGTWHLREVTVGENNDSFVVVTKGLTPGEVVAITPDVLWEDSNGDIPAPGGQSEGSSDPAGKASPSSDVARTGS